MALLKHARRALPGVQTDKLVDMGVSENIGDPNIVPSRIRIRTPK